MVFAIMALIILVGSLALSGICVRHFERKNRLKLSKELSGSGSSIDKEFDEKIDHDNMAPLLIIESDELTLVKELGAGAFGRVFVGYWIPKNLKSAEKEEVKREKFNMIE